MKSEKHVKELIDYIESDVYESSFRAVPSSFFLVRNVNVQIITSNDNLFMTFSRS